MSPCHVRLCRNDVPISNVFIRCTITLLTACMTTLCAHAHVPAPDPATTNYIIGANYFGGWKEGAGVGGWSRISAYSERTPTLGFYNEGSPEVADWEIKWAKENGIGFFNYVWCRDEHEVGRPVVKVPYGSALNDGMLNAVYRNQFNFTIQWENAYAGLNATSSAAALGDLQQNVFPYWKNQYFNQSSYLKVDNKPVLYILEPGNFIDQLGGQANAASAMNWMRQQVIDDPTTNYAGLYVIAKCESADPATLQYYKDSGFDANYAYRMQPASYPYSQQGAINYQVNVANAWKNESVMPFVSNATMGYDNRAWASILSPPWNPDDITHRWRLTPTNYQTLLSRQKAIMDSMPSGSLSSRMMLLGPWNEYGEGSYIAPHQQYGFDYLKAVRNVFTAKNNAPNYLTPQEQGFGPYDSRYRNYYSGDADGIVYQDRFTRSGDINRTSCDRAPRNPESGEVGWHTYWVGRPGHWTTNGSQAVLTAQGGNSLLPFTPADGKIYTLSADMQATGGDTDTWMAMGFTNSDDLFADALFSDTGVACWFQFAGSNDCYSVLGPQEADPAWHGTAGAGFHHYSVVLDTTDDNWKVQWFLNGQLQRTERYGVNPTIAFVGMGGSSSGLFDNFSLTVVPEPPTGMLAAAMLVAFVTLRGVPNKGRRHKG